MVGILIVFPQLVTFGLDKDVKVDLDSVQIEMPTSDYGVPSTPPGSDSSQAPPADAGDAAAKAIRDSIKQEQGK
jgi:hypothetical protein